MSRQAQFNHLVLRRGDPFPAVVRKRQNHERPKRCDIERTQTTVADLEDGGRRPRAKESLLPLAAREGRETDSPMEPPERNTALPTS